MFPRVTLIVCCCYIFWDNIRVISQYFSIFFPTPKFPSGYRYFLGLSLSFRCRTLLLQYLLMVTRFVLGGFRCGRALFVDLRSFDMGCFWRWRALLVDLRDRWRLLLQYLLMASRFVLAGFRCGRVLFVDLKSFDLDWRRRNNFRYRSMSSMLVAGICGIACKIITSWWIIILGPGGSVDADFSTDTSPAISDDGSVDLPHYIFYNQSGKNPPPP